MTTNGGGRAILRPEPLGLRADDGMLTPAGLQHRRELKARRVAFAALNLATLAALTLGLACVFGEGGWSFADGVIVGCFLIGGPWTVMGFWNAVIGVWLLHGRRNGVALAAPHLATEGTTDPPASGTAIAMTLRNEPPLRSYQRLAVIRAELDATPFAHLFDIHVLSDTDDPQIAHEEERLFHAMRGRLGGHRAHYRRRASNEGFKAGNVREFMVNRSRAYDFYLPLDSDSLMSAAAILQMVRIMEAHPRIGILQSLVVAAPASTAFARLFQFGMRHGMRSHTIGAAWWQGDCGPYWGHNALIRVTPFRRHCRLPVLPGRRPLGGHVLSHDQVEAALMRRAGYEVRVLPVEGESWESNPPTLLDFTKRDLRWCHGNMQYWRLIGLRGLHPVSRFQLIGAIAMYLGAPAWMLMTAAAAGKLVKGDATEVNLALGVAMFFIMFAISLVPKLMGMLDIALTPGSAARYGGRLRFALGGLAELLFSILLAPIVAVRVTIFLAGLACGRTVGWDGQRRDAYRLGWREAVDGVWPQTLLGLALLGSIAVAAGIETVAWAAPIVAGLILSIPFAVLTADPAFGLWAARTGLCAVPEEMAMPASLEHLEDRVTEPNELDTPPSRAA